MNRKLRFTFRNGDVRMGEMLPGQTLIQLWNIFRRDGAIIGDAWCAQFDHVAMIEVVEMPDQTDVVAKMEATVGRISDGIDRLAVVTSGGFKPPGEA